MRATIINIRAIVVEDTGVEDLMIAKSQLAIIDAGYTELKLETPEWVTNRLSEVTREILARVRAERERRLRELESRATALKPRSEVRKDVQKEIEALKAQLV